MDNILKKDWLISPPLDYEMKYYSLMGGLKSINEIIKNNQLYSAILKVESALHELYDIKYNRDIIEENNKVLIGIDTDNMSLDYEYKIEDDEIVKMYDAQNVTLADLLLMFIYIEVIGLVRSYWESRAVRVIYPLVIAITALARYIILQDKDSDPTNLIYLAFAILIVSLATVVIRFRRSKYLNIDKDKSNDL